MRAPLHCTLGLATGACLFLAVHQASAQETKTIDLTQPPTVEACAECHRDRVASFQATPHAVLDSENLAERSGFVSSCDACHHESELDHLTGGAVKPRCDRPDQSMTFRPDEPPLAKSSRCLTCHGAKNPRFQAGPHGRAGMDCASCHDAHGNNYGRWPLQKAVTSFNSALESEPVAGICWECHGDVFALFESSETHRLREGILECTSCHDPHSPQTRDMLGGFKQQQCVSCHADKGGPFVFEHGSVRVEGCTGCHSPHGSPNRHMLVNQRSAELCFSCHAAVPGFHSRFTLETVCENCHSSIHGSNFSPFFLK